MVNLADLTTEGEVRNTERIKQSRRHDATETVPITSYKVDMKICQTHSLCNCYHELKRQKQSEA